ncbi:hypothetical protein H6F89_08940 [Cyanobacteria bacterium FACHB-63]|nr:hypothetical protein [Cyanobacteria bacterium FACHB-63]
MAYLPQSPASSQSPRDCPNQDDLAPPQSSTVSLEPSLYFCLIATLQKLVENLYWMSETDAPIQVLQQRTCGAIETEEQLLDRTKHSAADRV